MARRRRYNRKRRKGNFAFLYKLLAFVLICGAIGLALAMFFRIDDIEISGNSRYSNEQIAAAAQIKAGDNLFFLNKYDAAARIRQQLPYVETVQFRRVLPSKLVVQITECRDPVAIKQDGTVYLLCDKGNIVDTVSAAKWSQYIQIEGLTLLNPQVGSEARASATQQAVLDQLLSMLVLLDDKGDAARSAGHRSVRCGAHHHAVHGAVPGGIPMECRLQLQAGLSGGSGGEAGGQ